MLNRARYATEKRNMLPKYFNKHFKTLLSRKDLKRPTSIQKSEPRECKCDEDSYFPEVLPYLWNSGGIKLLF